MAHCGYYRQRLFTVVLLCVTLHFLDEEQNFKDLCKQISLKVTQVMCYGIS